MALKPDVVAIEEDGFNFCDTVSERGGIMTIYTAGSGVSMDGARNVVAYDAWGSGKVPVGILMSPVVSKDLTHNWLIGSLDEVQVGGKVTLLTKGTVVTNFGYPGITITPGDPAYVAHSGYISNTRTNVGWARVGTWKTSKDQNGYARLDVNLPGLGPNVI